MSEVLNLVLEIVRGSKPDNPYEFDFRPQDYLIRWQDSRQYPFRLEWDAELLQALTELHGLNPDAGAVARLGDRLRGFLLNAGWAICEDRLVDSMQSGLASTLTMLLSSAELYSLPWELLRIRNICYVAERANLLVHYQMSGSPRPVAGARPRERVLFAWSNGEEAGGVPVQAHLTALSTAWGGRFDPERDVLANVGSRALIARLREATAAGRPVTILHLLCHGIGRDGSFGLSWTTPEGKPEVILPNERLRAVFWPHVSTLRTVVLCACYGGNHGRLANHLGSIALVLHSIGIRVVVASRFLLTPSGSVEFTGEFHGALASNPADVRGAFLAGRAKLLEGSAYDWLSFQLWGRAEDFEGDSLKQTEHIQQVRPVVGGYRVGQALLEAANVRLYEALSPNGRRVALQLSSETLDPDSINKQHERVSQVANLRCDHIIPLIDHGIHDGRVFAVTEDPTGQEFASWLKVNGPLTEKTCLELGAQLAYGLTVAHRRSLSHGWLSPGNIIVRGKSEAPELRIVGLGMGATRESGVRDDVRGLAEVLRWLFQQSAITESIVVESIINNAISPLPSSRPTEVEQIIDELRQAMTATRALTEPTERVSIPPQPAEHLHSAIWVGVHAWNHQLVFLADRKWTGATIEIPPVSDLHVGRAPEWEGERNDIVLSDSRISRLALTIRRADTRVWVRRAPKCTCRVKVGTEELAPGEEAVLHHGQSIELASIRGVFLDGRYADRAPLPGMVDPRTGLLGLEGLRWEAFANLRTGTTCYVMFVSADPVSPSAESDACALALAVHEIDDCIPVGCSECVVGALASNANSLSDLMTAALTAVGRTYRPATGPVMLPRTELEVTRLFAQALDPPETDHPGVHDPVSEFETRVLPILDAAGESFVVSQVPLDGLDRSVEDSTMRALHNELFQVAQELAGERIVAVQWHTGHTVIAGPQPVTPFIRELNDRWLSRGPIRIDDLLAEPRLTIETVRRPGVRKLRQAVDQAIQRIAAASTYENMPLPIASAARQFASSFNIVERADRFAQLVEATWSFLGLTLAAVAVCPPAAPGSIRLRAPSTRWPTLRGLVEEFGPRAVARGGRFGELASSLLDPARGLVSVLAEATALIANPENETNSDRGRIRWDTLDLDQRFRTLLAALEPISEWKLLAIRRVDFDPSEGQHNVLHVDYTGSHPDGRERQVGVVDGSRLGPVVYLARPTESAWLLLHPFIRVVETRRTHVLMCCTELIHTSGPKAYRDVVTGREHTIEVRPNQIPTALADRT